MTKSRMDQLGNELLQQSQKGKLTWEEVQGQERAYAVAFPEVTLVVSSWAPLRSCAWQTVREVSNSFNLDVVTYRLELRGQAGEVTETLLAIPGQANYRVLREVFSLAHQQASHAEKNIDKALEYLRGASA